MSVNTAIVLSWENLKIARIVSQEKEHPPGWQIRQAVHIKLPNEY